MGLIEDVYEIKNAMDIAIGFKQVQAKMVGTTNPRFGFMLGEIGNLSLENMMLHFNRGWHSSYLTSFQIKENLLTVFTRNSEYNFEILDKEFLSWYPNGVEYKLSERDIEVMEEYIIGVRI